MRQTSSMETGGGCCCGGDGGSRGMAREGDVIVDDGDGGTGWNAAVTPTGAWGYRTEGQHPGSYLDTGSHFGSGGDDTATYAVSLPAAGLWSVET